MLQCPSWMNPEGWNQHLSVIYCQKVVLNRYIYLVFWLTSFLWEAIRNERTSTVSTGRKKWWDFAGLSVQFQNEVTRSRQSCMILYFISLYGIVVILKRILQSRLWMTTQTLFVKQTKTGLDIGLCVHLMLTLLLGQTSSCGSQILQLLTLYL